MAEVNKPRDVNNNKLPFTEQLKNCSSDTDLCSTARVCVCMSVCVCLTTCAGVFSFLCVRVDGNEVTRCV